MNIDDYDRQYENHLREQEEQKAKNKQIADKEYRDFQEQEELRERESYRRKIELLECERDGNLTPEHKQELEELEKEDPKGIGELRETVY